MTARSKDSRSQLEKNFQTQSTFKRNSRYYDANQVTSMENKHSIKRRIPIHSQSPKGKFQANFTNSSVLLTAKLDKDIGKFRDRICSAPEEDRHSACSSRSTSPVTPRVKSFSIEKMLSRIYIDSRGKKKEVDERLFNNFKIEKHELSKTSDFGKLKERQLDLSIKHMNDLYHQNHQKLYQEYFYPKTSMDCRFNHKLENKSRKRFFFHKRRPQNDPSTVLNPEKVDHGFKIASNFKGSNLRKDGFDPFYKGSGRDLPCQFDSRFMDSLTNYYKGQDGRIRKQQLDYTVRKLKQDLETERKLKLRQSKKPSFARNQICDQRYFKINKE